MLRRLARRPAVLEVQASEAARIHLDGVWVGSTFLLSDELRGKLMPKREYRMTWQVDVGDVQVEEAP
jgi:hypothetical protein